MRSSRRQFLYLAIGALAWHGAAQGQSPADLHAAEDTQFPGLRLVNTRHMDSRLSLLGIRFGYVEQDVRLGTTGKYFCGALSVERSVTAAQPVAAAVARLPYVSVRKLGLRYVILCGSAKKYDRPIGGIPVPPLDLLMLSVGATENAAYLESLTRHELYHMAELRTNTLEDADWNQQFTGYANDYAADLLKGGMGGGNPGFLNAYAQTFPHEDRAELFSALLLRPDEVLARIRATDDAVLQRKVEYMDQKSERLLALKLVHGL
jgi:hypothetical protein